MTCYECIRQAYEKEKHKGNKMIIKSLITPQELMELLESMQSFYIQGLGTDREIIASIMVNRIMDADDKEKEYDYYNKTLNDVRRVLDSRKDIIYGNCQGKENHGKKI